MPTNDKDYKEMDDYRDTVMRKLKNKSHTFIKKFIYKTESFADAYFILYDIDITLFKPKQRNECIREYLDYKIMNNLIDIDTDKIRNN